MKDRRFEYLEIAECTQLPSIELKNADEFIKLAEELKNRFIFYTKNESETPSGYFLFLYDKMIYRIQRNGYHSLTDYGEAIENGFPSADTFYKARQGNFSTYKEYKDCEETGITDRGLYQKARKLGYVDNFTALLSKIKEKPQLLPEKFNPDIFTNPVVVCEYASSRGFKDYGDFQKAFLLGFTDKFLYDDAQKKNFVYASDYIKATQMGFDTAQEYQEAIFLKIDNKTDYLRYRQLKSLSQDKYAFDEVELIQKLRKIENGKKLSLSKVTDLLTEIVTSNQVKSISGKGKTLPEWYSRKLTNRAQLKTFLTGNEALERFGFFDVEGEYYQSAPLSQTNIYLDGSNVAFGESGKNAVPHYQNILLTIKKLKELRFSGIYIIADASLRHRVDDSQLLEQIKQESTYYEAPSNTTADEFLFSKIKNDKCFLITNDTFRDWKSKDHWVARNIDKLRVPFMIVDGQVSIPFLEREKEFV
jgi:hypothetical protein